MKKFFTISSIAWAILAHAQIVINEVYPAGGNSGSAIKQDFVELYNSGTDSIILNNAFLQYGPATRAMTVHALPTSITLAPGQFYLIQCGAGSSGTVDLINPDHKLDAVAMGVSAGKLALTRDNVPVTSSNQSNVIDFIGWGSTATLSETNPAPVPKVNASLNRKNGADNNDNAADFIVATPTPTNSQGQDTLSADHFQGLLKSFIKNSIVSNKILFDVKANVQIFSMNGELLKACHVDKATEMDISALPKGMYLVTAEADGEISTQKIMKK